MQFIGIDNPFGTDAMTTPTIGSIKPHKLPRVPRRKVVRRAPKPLSTVLKNFVLTYNG